ncbi:MAG: hypothetical protein AAFQ82_16170, partial [Myxococcota bacterium]
KRVSCERSGERVTLQELLNRRRRPLFARRLTESFLCPSKRSVYMTLSASIGETKVLSLLQGHALTRALAAYALGNPEAPTEPHWRLGVLVDALDDDYAAVRHLAWESIQRLLGDKAGDFDFDYIAPLNDRVELIGQLRSRLGPFPPPPRTSTEALSDLQALRDTRRVFVLE